MILFYILKNDIFGSHLTIARQSLKFQQMKQLICYLENRIASIS